MVHSLRRILFLLTPYSTTYGVLRTVLCTCSIQYLHTYSVQYVYCTIVLYGKYRTSTEYSKTSTMYSMHYIHCTVYSTECSTRTCLPYSTCTVCAHVNIQYTLYGIYCTYCVCFFEISVIGPRWRKGDEMVTSC